MDMGQKIGALRKDRNLTLAELGAKVGVGASTVRKWETGFIENIRSDKIQKLAAALETTPAYLMGWPEQEKAPAPRERLRSIARLQDADITEEEDRQVSDYIEFLLSKRNK